MDLIWHTSNGSCWRIPLDRYTGRNLPTSSLLYPKVICVRSLVPKEKNSASFAICTYQLEDEEHENIDTIIGEKGCKKKRKKNPFHLLGQLKETRNGENNDNPFFSLPLLQSKGLVSDKFSHLAKQNVSLISVSENLTILFGYHKTKHKWKRKFIATYLISNKGSSRNLNHGPYLEA